MAVQQDMPDWIGPILQQYGLPGVFILGLCYALIRIDNRRNDEIDARRTDALEWQAIVKNNTDAMEAIADSHADTVAVIEALAGAQRSTSEQLKILNAILRKHEG